MIVKKFLTITSLVSMALLFGSSAQAKLDIEFGKPSYIVVEGQFITLSDGLPKLLKQLDFAQDSQLVQYGKETSDLELVSKWVYPNGVTFIAIADPFSERIKELTISSSVEADDSYLVIDGHVNYLNRKNIKQLEKIYDDTYRCLFYSEEGGLGWLDYTVKNRANSDKYVTFSALNNSKYSLKSKQGKRLTKLNKIDSITLSKREESFAHKIYCKK